MPHHARFERHTPVLNATRPFVCVKRPFLCVKRPFIFSKRQFGNSSPPKKYPPPLKTQGAICTLRLRKCSGLSFCTVHFPLLQFGIIQERPLVHTLDISRNQFTLLAAPSGTRTCKVHLTSQSSDPSHIAKFSAVATKQLRQGLAFSENMASIAIAMLFEPELIRLVFIPHAPIADVIRPF